MEPIQSVKPNQAIIIEHERTLALEEIWRKRAIYFLLLSAILFVTYGIISLSVDLFEQDSEFWEVILLAIKTILLVIAGIFLGYRIGLRDGKTVTVKSIKIPSQRP